MKASNSSMGCIPSRSSVAPSGSRPDSSAKSVMPNQDVGRGLRGQVPEKSTTAEQQRSSDIIDKSYEVKAFDDQAKQQSSSGLDEDVMSIFMDVRDDGLNLGQHSLEESVNLTEPTLEKTETKAKDESQNGSPKSDKRVEDQLANAIPIEEGARTTTTRSSTGEQKSMKANSFDEEATLDLLRQYITVDYEIAQLEDRDALRAYHEKIEQLEQLERELDMISTETEEVAAAQGNSDLNKGELNQLSVDGRNNQGLDSRLDTENNSLISGNTGSVSQRSWTGVPDADTSFRAVNKDAIVDQTTGSRKSNHSNLLNDDRANTISAKDIPLSSREGGRATGASSRNISAYHTIEEVFNRKIILERERDKLKKEVETVIIECDKLQNRYKRRDEILDKLFEGKKGNGLENHLEQQLNWLLEQKHYVDQVFYAWKRAETLTSETCEQFASALEMLKRLNNFDGSPEERKQLVKDINELLIKSRQNMDQAQKYNPNVDAPFFTDSETERFDRVIETLSSNPSASIDYGQILTVIQFAYKRAVSIRLWLEQILQTTIARDSFELAEEYKWIAIQLRKERINLIRARLQESPYKSFSRSIQQRLAQQSLVDNQRRNIEVNRDSGVESEPNDFDIEEEIYRLLELNKSRFELQQQKNGANMASSTSILDKASNMNLVGSTNDTSRQFKVSQNQHISSSISSEYQGLHQKQQSRTSQLARDSTGSGRPINSVVGSSSTMLDSVGNNASSPAHKLKVELDDDAKRNLQRQLNQIHNKHRGRIESIRDNNKARATDSVASRMRQARQFGGELRPDRRTGQKSRADGLEAPKLFN